MFRAGLGVYPTCSGDSCELGKRGAIYFLQPGFSHGHHHFFPQMYKALITEIYSRLNFSLVQAMARALLARCAPSLGLLDIPYWQDVHPSLASWTSLEYFYVLCTFVYVIIINNNYIISIILTFSHLVQAPVHQFILYYHHSSSIIQC